MALVTYTRGDLSESVHECAYCVVRDGRVDRSSGDVDRPVHYRSAAKPIQAIAVVESGAPDEFGFSEEELAMVVGSHDGSPHHAGRAAAMLEKIGVGPEILRCGGHISLSRDVYERYVRDGYAWGRLEDNCSGKHSGMIGAARVWGEDPAAYAELQSRIQQENLANVARLTGVARDEIGIGIDGCAVPSFAVPLRAMALAAARFGTPDDHVDAIARIWTAVQNHPEMIAGEKRFDTRVIRAGAGKLLAKEGAEGVQIVAVRGERTGLAIKVWDGGKRALRALCAALLADLGLVPADVFPAGAVLSREGDPVGEVRVTL